MKPAHDQRGLLLENAQLREEIAVLRQRLRQAGDEVASLSAVVVAGATLHAAGNLLSVVGAIEQIMLNLVGADRFALFQVDGADWQLMHCLGVSPADALESVAGSALVAQSVQSGDTWAAPSEQDEVLACIPILTERRVSAVIVVFGLLPQKERFLPSDFDVFELLTSQAGAVLRAAGFHQESDHDERADSGR